MGLRINTNVPALSSQRALSGTQALMQSNLRRLSSGERITRAGDDAAGLAISENLKAQIRGIRQSKRNAGDSISMIQTAEGGLSEISSILIRLRELAIQTSSDTVGDKERGFTNIEFQNLKEEIDRIARSSQFNGIKLLSGEGGLLEFQVGINNDPFLDRLTYDTTTANATIGSLGIGELDISSKLGSQMSLSNIDDAIVNINGMRANLGAKQNRLTSTINNLEINDENLSAANSRIRDVDVASESSELTRNRILVQSGVAVLSQANQLPNIALKLIEG
jgi:flagellin